MDDNRKKALSAALGQIEKQFGKGSVMRLGDASATYDVEAVSTGSLGLDIALGIGGLPRGRVVEIYGPESSGKTTLAMALPMMQALMLMLLIMCLACWLAQPRTCQSVTDRKPLNRACARPRDRITSCGYTLRGRPFAQALPPLGRR